MSPQTGNKKLLVIAALLFVASTLHGCFFGGSDDKKDDKEDDKKDEKKDVSPSPSPSPPPEPGCPENRLGVRICTGNSEECNKMKQRCYRITTGGERMSWCHLDPYMNTYKWWCQGSRDAGSAQCVSGTGTSTKMVWCAEKCPPYAKICQSAFNDMMRRKEWRNENHGWSSSLSQVNLTANVSAVRIDAHLRGSGGSRREEHRVQKVIEADARSI
eukprot:TRINITY_DN773_c0_g1_i3.p1 TRINITY_DN773_c0_g1~~TRINITY_DN773_c0_g1_i3.p1  ORF type:complete len:244 (-),score=41.68 TRINITY_DN773_c0_g1_i3:247-891(-)